MNGYRKRNYSTAFSSSSGGRTTFRIVPTPSWGSSSRSGYVRSRGSRYGRYGGGYRRSGNAINRALSTYSRPVYPIPEKKWVEAGLGNVAITLTGSVSLLNALPQGTGSQARIGSQASFNEVYYQYTLQNGATPIPTVVRMMLVWDRQPNGSATPATIADILQTATGPVPAYVAANNLSNKHRFVIIADERTSLSPNGEQIEYETGYRKINQLTEYVESTQFPQTGALLLALMSNTAVAASQPLITGNWRMRFKDA